MAKMSRHTAVSCEDKGNLQDALDRCAECSLRRDYSAALAQHLVGIASWEVSRSLRNWIMQIQHDIDAGIPCDNILDAFKRVNLATDFLCDLAFVKLFGHSYCTVNNGKNLWLKPWKADLLM